MEYVSGYFTIERNLVGVSLQEMESTLGFRPGRLTSGARIVVLLRQPLAGEFAFAGSTFLEEDARALVPLDQRKNVPVPHAWLGQRLLKVIPNLGHSEQERYPSATRPVEQWQLTVPTFPAEHVCHLKIGDVYWPPRR